MKRMGLVKCNDKLEVTKVKPAYYTVQNVATLFDATIEPAKFPVRLVPGETAPGLVVYTFRQKETDIPLVAFWDASKHPENDNTVRRASFNVGAALEEPVWIDLVTGAIYRIPDRMMIGQQGHKGKGTLFEDVPYYDAPVVITDKSLVIKGK